MAHLPTGYKEEKMERKTKKQTQDQNQSRFVFHRATQSGLPTSSAYVVRPDGSLREPDEVLSMNDATVDDQITIWHHVQEDELSLGWSKTSQYHNFWSHHVPSQLTAEALQTVERLEDNIRDQHDSLIDYANPYGWDTSLHTVRLGWKLNRPQLTQAQLIEVVNHTQARLKKLPDLYYERPDARVSLEGNGWRLILRVFDEEERTYALSQYEVERWMARVEAFEKHAAIMARRREAEERYLAHHLNLRAAIRAAGGKMSTVGADGVLVSINEVTRVYALNQEDSNELDDLVKRLVHNHS